MKHLFKRKKTLLKLALPKLYFLYTTWKVLVNRERKKIENKFGALAAELYMTSLPRNFSEWVKKLSGYKFSIPTEKDFVAKIESEFKKQKPPSAPFMNRKERRANARKRI